MHTIGCCHLGLLTDFFSADPQMVLLRQELLTACAERDRLLAERARDAACNQSSASTSMTSLTEGGDLQEILQGVREVMVHGQQGQNLTLPLKGPWN